MYANIVNCFVRKRSNDFQVQVDIIGVKKLINFVNWLKWTESSICPKSRKLFYVFRRSIEVNYYGNFSGSELKKEEKRDEVEMHDGKCCFRRNSESKNLTCSKFVVNS